MKLGNPLSETIKKLLNSFVRAEVSTSVTLATRTDIPLNSPWVTIYISVWGEINNKINIDEINDIR